MAVHHGLAVLTARVRHAHGHHVCGSDPEIVQTSITSTGVGASGLELEQRLADWHGASFTSDSESHVSVWRKPLDAPEEG